MTGTVFKPPKHMATKRRFHFAHTASTLHSRKSSQITFSKSRALKGRVSCISHWRTKSEARDWAVWAFCCYFFLIRLFCAFGALER
ncbi:hypothetical protein CC86DRAFT_91827 [Ophiobolus disseminans]|uniref:Uncharacterized protein n=1 Tax=Ophiobolus disseminans TaxID=1469910 RepID=A0A6A7AHB8_9PLEO|nr:hypothetical protein CC86DRAFT_91827 [Ophiobolus disseminans]